MKKYLIVVVILVFIALMILNHQDYEYKIQPKDALDEYIDKLITYECAECIKKPEIDFKILDSNQKYSYGCLQFQKETFLEKVKAYKILPEAEDEEIVNLIYHCDVQKKVARKMFENEKNAWRHWYTSIEKRGLGRPPIVNG